jgi:hypothetical protein
VDCVYLIRATGDGETQPVAVKKRNHILAVYTTVLGLPANVECAAELDVSE